MKSRIVRVGTGTNARIALRLRDKPELKGYISETTDDHFVIVDEKTGTATTVTYAQVEKIKAGNSASARDVSGGRVLRNAAVGLGLAVTGLMVICLVSKRCVE